MWLQSLADLTIFSVPLWVILLCGFLGVLVDIDHLISYFWFPSLRRRFFHTPVLIIGFCIFCLASACIGGLLFEVVLVG